MSFGSHSLPPPTPEESDRIARAKMRGCVACDLRGFTRLPPAEFNHAKVGNVRAGHRFGYALCPFHHRGELPRHVTSAAAWMFYKTERGPSLAHGSKTFHDAFGSDQALQDRQDDMLGLPRVAIQRTRRGKSTATPSKCVERRL